MAAAADRARRRDDGPGGGAAEGAVEGAVEGAATATDVRPAAHGRTLHEEATADRAAADGLWLPVFEHAREHRWDLVLVVDNHTSMIFWQEAVTSFTAALEQSGAFRNVTRRRLITGGGSPASVLLRGGRPGSASPPAEIADPSGRRLILVITDWIGRA